MALVTDNFRIYAAESFRNTLQAANKVYMFVGRAKTWGSTDVPPTGEPLMVTPLHLSVLIYPILL